MSDPLKPFRAARVNDTDRDLAVDWDAMTIDDVAAYMQTRDADKLKMRDGQEPTWFHIARLPSSFLASTLDAVASLTARQTLAFRAACHMVEIAGEPALQAHPRDAAPEGSRFVCLPRERGADIAPETWVQEIADRFGMETVYEMGQVALDSARLPKGKRTGFRWWRG